MMIIGVQVLQCSDEMFSTHVHTHRFHIYLFFIFHIYFISIIHVPFGTLPCVLCSITGTQHPTPSPHPIRQQPRTRITFGHARPTRWVHDVWVGVPTVLPSFVHWKRWSTFETFNVWHIESGLGTFIHNVVSFGIVIGPID